MLQAKQLPESKPGPGLSSSQARARLNQSGPNVLEEATGPHWLKRLARNFTYLFAALLWAAAALALLAGEVPVAVAIVLVIIVNALFSFAQEYRAEQAVQALRRVLPQTSLVRRDEHAREVESAEIVPGDILLLSPGDRIPADGELVRSAALKVDVSMITGESKPVPVGTDGKVFAGTYVTAGTAEAITTATGMTTQLGRIASLSRGTLAGTSPLEREMSDMTKAVAALAISIGVIFFLVSGMLGMGLSERFVFAIGVIVALVPEGLLPTVTLSLALAAQRMARRNAVVRRLSSVETLGETTVICTDKTGTLTTNEMTVRQVWAGGELLNVSGAGYRPEGEITPVNSDNAPSAVTDLCLAAALCNNAHLETGTWAVTGDPTEAALLTLALKVGLDPSREAARRPRCHEIPFDASIKRMATFHREGGDLVVFAKGAPGSIIPLCDLGRGEAREAFSAASTMARQSLRVLAVARRRGGVIDSADQGLELLGVVGMEDPPRPEVTDALRRCRSAGIRVILVTGDHALTAAATAREVGLITGSGVTLEGPEIKELDEEPLRAALLRPDVVISRVTPEQKLRIARALKGGGEVVAMTGDGVNDAPALQAADIGVAMGRGGTDVAREAADIVLLDDNFASIAAAVEEGRAVYANIRRFAQYHFSGNVGELVAFLAWGLSGGLIPLPLVVMQVLAIDLGTDIVPAIALGTEKANPGTMDRSPRPRDERLLNRRALLRVFGFIGLLVGLAGVASFFAANLLAGWEPGKTLAAEGAVYAQATAGTYAGIVMAQVGAAFAFRTAIRPVRAIGLLSNRFLVVANGFAMLVLLSLLYIPALQAVFHTRAPDPALWLLLVCWPPLVFGLEEARKALVRLWLRGAS